MIAQPSLSKVLDDYEKAQLHTLSEIQEISQQFEAKRLYPELTQLVRAAYSCVDVIENQDNIRLVFDSVASVTQIASLKKLYSPDDLAVIDSTKKLELLLAFTQWLFRRYYQLAKQGAPLSNDITRDLCISIRPPFVHTARGIVYLQYQDESGRRQARVYQYRKSRKRVKSGEKIFYRLFLSEDVRLQSTVCSPTRLQANQGSLIRIDSNVPASLDSTILPIVRNVLLKRLIKMTKTLRNT